MDGPNGGTNIGNTYIQLQGIVSQFNSAFKTKFKSFIKRNEFEDKLTYYAPGVGLPSLENVMNMPLEIVTGSGMDLRALHAYEFLIKYYEPGTVVKMVGFSRGSATARMLCTFLNDYGLHDSYLIGKSYLKTPFVKIFNGDTSYARHEDARSIEIDSIGLYDTVARVGGVTPIEFDDLVNLNGNVGYPCLSLDIPSNVKFVLHLVAGNEYRFWIKLNPLQMAHDNHFTSFSEIALIGTHEDIGGKGNRPRQLISYTLMNEFLNDDELEPNYSLDLSKINLQSPVDVPFYVQMAFQTRQYKMLELRNVKEHHPFIKEYLKSKNINNLHLIGLCHPTVN